MRESISTSTAVLPRERCCASSVCRAAADCCASTSTARLINAWSDRWSKLWGDVVQLWGCTHCTHRQAYQVCHHLPLRHIHRTKCPPVRWVHAQGNLTLLQQVAMSARQGLLQHLHGSQVHLQLFYQSAVLLLNAAHVPRHLAARKHACPRSCGVVTSLPVSRAPLPKL